MAMMSYLLFEFFHFLKQLRQDSVVCSASVILRQTRTVNISRHMCLSPRALICHTFLNTTIMCTQILESSQISNHADCQCRASTSLLAQRRRAPRPPAAPPGGPPRILQNTPRECSCSTNVARKTFRRIRTHQLQTCQHHSQSLLHRSIADFLPLLLLTGPRALVGQRHRRSSI